MHPLADEAQQHVVSGSLAQSHYACRCRRCMTYQMIEVCGGNGVCTARPQPVINRGDGEPEAPALAAIIRDDSFEATLDAL